MSAATPTKKTIYIDVDEEITGIIDKVRSSSESIVALVLPKRATMLQSVVNMKLLKRAATQSDKKVVLITSESTLMPLAGSAGLFVASNLQSRPYVPAAAAGAAERLPIGPEADDDVEEDPNIDPSTPIGKLMEEKSGKKSSSAAAASSSNEPIEIDNTPKEKPDPKAAAAVAAAKTKKDKNKKVPNFNKFRGRLIIGGIALLALLVFSWWAIAVAPRATVTLRTESSEANVSADFTADTKADEVNLEKAVLPAELKEVKKNQSEKVPATGERDDGTKASGTIALRNCTDNDITIPAGTGVSNGNFTFITQEAIHLNDGNFDSSNNCKTNGSHTGNINVVAQKNGDQYNLSARSYTVSGFSGVLAQGAQMNGGTSKIVKIVSAGDVENAKKKIADKQNAVVEEIKTSLKDEGYIGLVDTFSAGNPAYTVTPAVNSEASEVTVSGEVTYTMIGIKEDDLKKIVEAQAKDDGVDTSKQSVLSYGFDDATFEIGDKNATTAEVNLKTKLVAGPELNQDELKKELAGKKRGDAENMLKSRPGVTEARVEFKPFWVSKVPSKAEKVKFNIEQANGTPITP